MGGGGAVLFCGHNLLSLVELGLTDLPKSGVAMAPTVPPGTTSLKYLQSVPYNLNNNMKCCIYVSHFTTTFLAQDFSSQSVKEKQSLPLSLLTHAAQLSSLFPSLSKCLPTSCLRILGSSSNHSIFQKGSLIILHINVYQKSIVSRVTYLPQS